MRSISSCPLRINPPWRILSRRLPGARGQAVPAMQWTARPPGTRVKLGPGGQSPRVTGHEGWGARVARALASSDRAGPPRRAAATRSRRTAAMSQGPAPVSLVRPTILVVEDDVGLRQSLHDLLGGEGYAVKD